MKREYIKSDGLITLNRKTKTKAYWCKHYNLEESEFDRLYYSGKSPRQIFGVKRKATKEKLFTIDGETKNFGEWCKYYGKGTNTVRHRIKKLGMSLEQALKTPTLPKTEKKKIEKNSKFYTFHGKTKNISEWCEYYGINRSTFYKRRGRGMSAIEAFKTPTHDCF